MNKMGRPKTQPLFCNHCGNEGTYARGLCRTCYNRLMRTGSVEPNPRADELKERNLEIAREWVGGKTIREIADKYGMSFQRVQQISSKYARRLNSYRIRHMTDEELANWLINIAMQCMAVSGKYDYLTNKTWWLEWLKAEAEE